MRQTDGPNLDPAPAVSAYMPSYNSTTTGRLRRIRQTRPGASPHRFGDSSDAKASSSSNASASPARQRRCPMVLRDRATSSTELRMYRQQEPSSDRHQSEYNRSRSTTQSRESSTLVDYSATTARPTNHCDNRKEANGAKHELSSSGRRFFLRPPNGSHVPARLDSYEKYVQACIRRHREASSSSRNSWHGRKSDQESRNEVNVVDSNPTNRYIVGSSDSAEIFDKSDESVRHGGTFATANPDSNALSRSTSALDSVCFVGSSDEFEESSGSSGAAAKAWNVIRKPIEASRPPRFGPEVSIDEMRRAVSTRSNKGQRIPRAKASTNIEAEYLSNLTALQKLGAASSATASSSTSSFGGLSLSLSAELRANQSGRISYGK